MRLIVCDTGPILHLEEAKLLKLLQRAGKIYIPQTVDVEISEIQPSWGKHRPDWLIVKTLLPDEIIEAESLFFSGLLDFGEAEAIILAKRLNFALDFKRYLIAGTKGIKDNF